MKNSISTIILLLSLCNGLCQQNETKFICHPDNIVFYIVKEMPILQISIKELENYMTENIEFKKEYNNNQEYEFYIRFIVNCKGIAGDYVIIKSELKNLNKQIVSLLENKCTWIPGVQKNTNVDVYCSFMIKLKNEVFNIELKYFRPLGK